MESSVFHSFLSKLEARIILVTVLGLPVGTIYWHEICLPMDGCRLRLMRTSSDLHSLMHTARWFYGWKLLLFTRWMQADESILPLRRRSFTESCSHVQRVELLAGKVNVCRPPQLPHSDIYWLDAALLHNFAGFAITDWCCLHIVTSQFYWLLLRSQCDWYCMLLFSWWRLAVTFTCWGRALCGSGWRSCLLSCLGPNTLGVGGRWPR
jgi:hypothetical protein